ncbi:MAG: M23 family metallopeptidase, partial [Dehalococcoidia bacterium]
MPFFVSALAASITIVAAIMPPLGIPGLSTTHADVPPFPAPPGYVLPWAGGEIHAVTQGEETTLTHNGSAAYAFDFDLTTDTVAAARGGRVTMIRMDSNVGGCSSAFSGSANYVVIDHGDGTSGLYLHLAQNGVFVKPGDMVWQGQYIGISGATGLTCSDNDAGPGPHLHFQVQRTEPNHYFTQSMPIAFDDIPGNEGVPQPDHSYVSGNYGHGKEQKLKLTPHRDLRPFAPIARPADPALLEGQHIAVPPIIGAPDTPTPEPVNPGPTSNDAPASNDTPTPTDTPRPTRTPSVTPSATPTPPPDATATPL